MSHPIVALAILSLVLCSSCQRTAPLTTTPINTVANDNPVANDNDVAVIKTALAHFAQQDVAGNASAEAIKKLIVVNQLTSGPGFYISEDQLNGELHSEKWKLSDELRRQLQQRNTQESTLPPSLAGDNLVLDDLRPMHGLEFDEKFEKKHPSAIRSVTLWLPGYSSDQTEAVMRFSFGPTAHGATATYLLVKEAGMWKVKHFMIAYYA